MDICVISRSKGVNMLRNYRKPNERLFRADLSGYKFKRGTTEWLSEVREIFKKKIIVEEITAPAKSPAVGASSAPASS